MNSIIQVAKKIMKINEEIETERKKLKMTQIYVDNKFFRMFRYGRLLVKFHEFKRFFSRDNRFSKLIYIFPSTWEKKQNCSFHCYQLYLIDQFTLVMMKCKMDESGKHWTCEGERNRIAFLNMPLFLKLETVST